MKAKDCKLRKVREELVRLRKQDEAVKEKEAEFSQDELALKETQRQLAEENYAVAERENLKETDKQIEKLRPIQTKYGEIRENIKGLEKLQVEEKYHTNKEKVSKKSAISDEISENLEKEASLSSELENDKKVFQKKCEDFECQKGILKEIETLESSERRSRFQTRKEEW